MCFASSASAPESPSDQALFERVAAGDASAWAAFVDRFGGLAASVPRRAGLPPDAVDDVLQATWLQLLRHAPLLRAPRSLPNWILTTAARETWRLARSSAHRRHVEEDAARHEEIPPGDLELGELEQHHLLYRGLESLTERCRKLLRALFLEGARPQYETLSQQLGMPVGSIGPTRQRCLAQLAVRLEQVGFNREESLGGPS